MAFQGLNNGQRAERKTFITVAEWGTDGDQKREILGVRTEDSSLELNADVEKMTDIRGITYADVNRTEPQQDFDPYNIMGGSELAEYLAKAALENDIAKYNGVFNVYLILSVLGTDGAYYAVKHTGCSIIPTSIGGDAYVSMPLEVHLSNNITVGSVDKLADDFQFTPNVNME